MVPSMMPSHAVGDAFYGGIVSITYSVSRHPLLSWKASEQPLEGIVINAPPILLCLGCRMKSFEIHQKLRCADFVPRPPVFFGNACVYRGFKTGGLQIRPPLHLP